MGAEGVMGFGQGGKEEVTFELFLTI